MEKEELINQLQKLIDVVERDGVRLDDVTITEQPYYAEVYAGTLVESHKDGQRYVVDFDVKFVD